jgi:hypothetical protein
MTCVLGLLLSAATAGGYYTGIIEAGRQTLQVGLELVVEGSTVSGNCFYLAQKAGDIPIKGTVAPDGALRWEEIGDERQITGVWSGRLANGVISGTWQNPTSGKRWPFRLTAQRARGRYVTEPVELKDASTLGPLTYRMAESPVSEMRVPQITAFADGRVMEAINGQLMGPARNAVCGTKQNDHEFEAEVAYAGQDVFSVKIRDSWFCGAAYPTNDADLSLTFDLRTGEIVDHAALFRKGIEGKALDEVYYAYELAQLRPRARQWCAKEADLMDDKSLLEEEACMNAFEEQISENDEDYCRLQYTPPHLAQTGASFFFSPEGMVVRPEWPHVIAGCADEITVPYGALAPLAAPGKALARVADAHRDAPLRYRIHRSGAKPEDDVLYAPPR